MLRSGEAGVTVNNSLTNFLPKEKIQLLRASAAFKPSGLRCDSSYLIADASSCFV